jgi:hypothetical protein
MRTKPATDVRSLWGIVRSPRTRPISIREMNRAIAEGYADRAAVPAIRER